MEPGPNLENLRPMGGAALSAPKPTSCRTVTMILHSGTLWLKSISHIEDARDENLPSQIGSPH